MHLSSSSLAPLASVFFSLASFVLAREEAAVVSLCEKSFDTFIKDNNVSLIEFFAPCS